jgi:hypothetical protein
MPYILMKRSDVPAGALQNLELKPNTSQRRFPYQNPGQTGYRVPPANDAVTLTGGVNDTTAAGLSAWFVSEVNDGTGVAASGTAALTSVVNGNTLTIGTTPNAVFTAAATDVSGSLNFLNTATATSDILAAGSLAAAINDDANWAAVGIARPVSAANGVSNTVTITALADGTAGNYTLTVNAGTIVPIGMASGVDADSITGPQGVVDAADVLTLLSYGSLLVAPGVLTLAAINGALTTGAIVAAQLSEVLDILAGRPFVMAAGAVVATGGVWAAGAGTFTDDPAGIRRVYETGSLRNSFLNGRLAQWTSNAFVYGNNAGAALAVYNDDGTLYTGA